MKSGYVPVLGAAIGIAAVMAFFCAMTPWVYDDFNYGAGDGGLGAMFAAQVQEYRSWSGKFAGHFMARVLLHGPAWLHPLLTSVIFTGLIFSGVLLSLGVRWREKIRAWHPVVLAGLVWFALPAFGTVYFWRTGTADYGYSLAFATAFLVPYRFWAEKKDYCLSGGPVYALAGFLAGCSNENVGMLSILTASSVAVCRFHTTRRLPLWAAAGIAGAVAGWTLMMAAPGNAVRLAQIGGVEKIPLFSLESFHRFLIFWGSQQLEMLPYILAALVAACLLYYRGERNPSAYLPGAAFFVMAQVSLAAFVLSPSTPYRAMSATFFYAALCCFAFLASGEFRGGAAKACCAIFCVVLLASVLAEARVFVLARPALQERELARASGTDTVRAYEYPETDKYFFLGYDIREIDLYGTGWRDRVSWEEAKPMAVAGMKNVSGLVICNVAYLENLPAGTVHIAAVAHRPTVAALVQGVLRVLSPLGDAASPSAAAVTARFALASAPVTGDGKAAVHMGGLVALEDIACLAVKEAGKPLRWERVAWPER